MYVCICIYIRKYIRIYTYIYKFIEHNCTCFTNLWYKMSQKWSTKLHSWKNEYMDIWIHKYMNIRLENQIIEIEYVKAIKEVCKFYI